MIHLLLAVIYLAFISLGLPDGILGAAWPVMYAQLEADVSWAGIISMIICCGTVTSSLMSDWLTRKFGAGVVTAFSVATTALALLGFSFSSRFWMLCLFAIPYGLGAGSIDAALNNYVALHYDSKHMSWLHCMWGIGATAGPYIMGTCFTLGLNWPTGYQTIGFVQILLAVVMFVTLPLWKKTDPPSEAVPSHPLSLRQTFALPGVKTLLVAFFCYCAAESTIFLWSSSFMVLHRGIPEDTAASFASLFFIGMTVGRALNGFLTIKWRDDVLIRGGSVIIIAALFLLLIPDSTVTILLGFLLLGLGCAPIYPCIIHSTPAMFGAENSQAVIGVEMACAYFGALAMPPLFGLIANYVHIGLFSVYLLVLILLMLVCYTLLLRKKR